MVHSNRNLHRRPRIERRVLAILRGAEQLNTSTGDDNAFRRLRRLAARKNLDILPPQANYVGDDELTLLAWIAAAQRIYATDLQPSDRCLLRIINHCARLLDNAGMRLYPLTLYKHWLLST